MTEDERQIDHLGVRPSWDCVACGQPWPCANAKEELLTEFRNFPSVLAIYMSAQLTEAFDDLSATSGHPPPDLYDRFIAWIHRAIQPEPADPSSPAGDPAEPRRDDPTNLDR